jgi:hypothetical protein
MRSTADERPCDSNSARTKDRTEHRVESEDAGLTHVPMNERLDKDPDAPVRLGILDRQLLGNRAELGCRPTYRDPLAQPSEHFERVTMAAFDPHRISAPRLAFSQRRKFISEYARLRRECALQFLERERRASNTNV